MIPGFMDLRHGVEDDDSTHVAKDALVLMVVSVVVPGRFLVAFFMVSVEKREKIL